MHRPAFEATCRPGFREQGHVPQAEMPSAVRRGKGTRWLFRHPDAEGVLPFPKSDARHNPLSQHLNLFLTQRLFALRRHESPCWTISRIRLSSGCSMSMAGPLSPPLTKVNLKRRRSRPAWRVLLAMTFLAMNLEKRRDVLLECQKGAVFPLSVSDKSQGLDAIHNHITNFGNNRNRIVSFKEIMGPLEAAVLPIDSTRIECVGEPRCSASFAPRHQLFHE